MFRYFRVDKSLEADGAHFRWTSYYEYTDDSFCTRQIDVFPDSVLLLRRPECCEAPLASMSFERHNEISGEEFVRLWDKSRKIPHSTRRLDSPLIRWGLRMPLPPVELVVEED